MKKLFEIATAEEVKSLETEHPDALQAIQYLIGHPSAVAKIPHSHRKQKTIWQYASRHGMRIQTRKRGAVMFLRIWREGNVPWPLEFHKPKKGASIPAATGNQAKDSDLPHPPVSPAKAAGGNVDEMLKLAAFVSR